MLYRYLTGLFCATCALVMLASCGDSKANGTGEFATVQANASYTGASSSLDLTTASTVPAVGIYTITSAAYTVPNTGATSPIAVSNLTINRITVSLTPALTSYPALGNLAVSYPTASQPLVIVGANLINVEIVTAALKSFLQANVPAGATVCYHATVSFDMLEVNTNRAATVTAPGFLVVNFTNS